MPPPDQVREIQAAVQAAAMIGDYILVADLALTLPFVICHHCAGPLSDYAFSTTLLQNGINAWGSICYWCPRLLCKTARNMLKIDSAWLLNPTP
jgi:hypothetical protein